MTNEPKNVIWRWTPDPRQHDEFDELADEYAVEQRPKAIAGIVLWAKYRGEWHANPSGASSRWVIVKLLSDLGKPEGTTLERIEINGDV